MYNTVYVSKHRIPILTLNPINFTAYASDFYDEVRYM